MPNSKEWCSFRDSSVTATMGELFAGEGGEGASAGGDAGGRREAPFVALPRL